MTFMKIVYATLLLSVLLPGIKADEDSKVSTNKPEPVKPSPKPPDPDPAPDPSPPKEIDEFYNPGEEVENVHIDANLEFTGEHPHKHSRLEQYGTFRTVMRFSYDEHDEKGPKNWGDLPGAFMTTNECGAGSYSPLNILPEACTVLDPKMDETIADSLKPSLLFDVQKKIENAVWYFGHPPDTYFGVEIRAGAYGMFQVTDTYDSHLGEAGDMTSLRYDFNFATITYCDHEKSKNAGRSSHQINGKKFPLEIHMLFFAVTPEFGMDSLTFGSDKDRFVMISILGELSKTDNPNLKPLVDAAKAFSGPSYEEDWTNIPIRQPFSPSWLLPRDSSYFYYSGSFPIPPCFSIARIYVLEKPIPISKKQLSAFTNLKTARETSGRLPCTQGLLKSHLHPQEILYNVYKIKIKGKDMRPLDKRNAGGAAGAQLSMDAPNCGHVNRFIIYGYIIIPIVLSLTLAVILA